MQTAQTPKATLHIMIEGDKVTITIRHTFQNCDLEQLAKPLKKP